MTSNRDADVIVVGAGIGGLTAAAYLAAAGKRVLVVDRGTRPGGHGTVFERGGYEFDIGLMFVASGMDDRPEPDRWLAPLGIALRWNRIDSMDKVVFGDNPDGPVDWDVPVLRVKDTNGAVRFSGTTQVRGS